MKKIETYKIFTFLLALMSFSFTFAIENPIEAKSFTELLTSVLNIIIEIGIPILVLMIIYSGFLFVTARGNSEGLQKAKDAILYTLIGAAIILGSYVIADAVKNTVDSLKTEASNSIKLATIINNY